jgi:hypothetical protein
MLQNDTSGRFGGRSRHDLFFGGDIAALTPLNGNVVA